MKLERLKAMSLTEIAYRSRQEASKWLERVGANGHGRGDGKESFTKVLAKDALARLPWQTDRGRNFAGAGKILWQRFQEAGASRFFEGAADLRTAEHLQANMPEAAARIIAEADQVCGGRFSLLGHRDLFFGDPIDWQLDPLSRRRSALTHWSRINALDAAAVGDSKVVWELSRHQWMIYLGEAYRLTGEEKYAAAFADYLGQWIRANPRGAGINWGSSLEAALRIISWSWALFLFRGSESLSPELFVRMLEGISSHAAQVEKYLSYYFAPNTHLTGEALGLFYAGTVFPELHSARRWRELGARILIEESKRQILDDGVYFEQSTCYQRYTAEIYLHFLILAERNGIVIPASVEERLRRLLNVLVALNRPDGSLPDIGDADGGWLLPFDLRAADDCRGVFAVAATVFKHPDYASVAAGPAPESLWLLGLQRHNAVKQLQPSVPRAGNVQVYHHGGYVVVRSGWSRDAHQLIFDVGPLSSPKSGHGHADLLSVQCSVFGEPYLVDPGTYCYTPEPEWRDFFRSSAAHSTVTVDGESQALPAGPFHWKNHPQARLRRWLSTDYYDFIDAEHDGYMRLFDPVLHRRRIVFVDRRYWIVVDDLVGSAEHSIELRFQFAAIQTAIEAGHWVRARGKNGHGLLLRTFTSVPFRMELVKGSVIPIQGWISPVYGQRLPAPVFICSAKVRLPLRTMTLLFPIENSSEPHPNVMPVLSGDGGPSGLILDQDETIMIHDNEVVAIKGKRMNFT